MAVKIVTDSTADIPKTMAQQLGIEVVPLKVRFGEEEFLDGVNLTPDEFYRRLTSGNVLPVTSQPSVGEFVEAYRRAGEGSDGIVSIHVSSLVSGTIQAAAQAKEQADSQGPIEVVDSYQASMGLGMAVLAAARRAADGGDFESVLQTARDAVGKCECFALLDTLEYLEKGGRIGKARAIMATLLKIKPMIILREGVVHELGKERTRKRAIARLGTVAREFAPIEELAVVYSGEPASAAALAEELGNLLPEGREPILTQFGPVIGTYTGPGALGIGLLKA